MKITFLAGVILFFCACTQQPVLAPKRLPPGNWELDKTHASLVFRIAHGNGLSQFTGRFDDFDASLFFDPSQPEKSRLYVQITAASVNTGVAALDQKLINNPSALDANTYPVISFESSDILVTGSKTGTIAGTLLLHGQSRQIILYTTWNGAAHDPLRKGQVAGFSAVAEIDRTDFGVDAWKNFGVGETIRFAVEVEFVRQ